MTSQQEKQPGPQQAPVPPPAPQATPLPSEQFVSSTSTEPSTQSMTSPSGGSAQPTSTPTTQPPQQSKKQTEQDREETVKKARALLDAQVKAIAKRENLPENMVRMELFLESRMRKLFGSRLDSVGGKIQNLSEGVDSIRKDLQSMLEKTWVIPENQPPLETPPVEEMPAAPPEPPVDPDDPIFGTLTLFLMGGS